MRLLLDTNIYVYMVSDIELLTSDVYALLEDYENQKFLSMESIKELIIAFRTKKLLSKIWKTEQDLVNHIVNDPSIIIDSIDIPVIRQLANLQINSQQDHRDPSDQIIISQAIAHRMTLISSDHKFPFYREQGLQLVYNQK